MVLHRLSTPCSGRVAYRILAIFSIGLAMVGCRRNDRTDGVAVEVAPLVSVNLRASGHAADLSQTKIIGKATASEIKEVAEVIGRIVIVLPGKVEHVQFTQRPDGIQVDFALGHDYISMRKVNEKWIIYAKGHIY